MAVSAAEVSRGLPVAEGLRARSDEFHGDFSLEIEFLRLAESFDGLMKDSFRGSGYGFKWNMPTCSEQACPQTKTTKNSTLTDSRFMITARVPLFLAFIFTMCPSVFGAEDVQSAVIPDLTKGDVIPSRAIHDWNLGATGARGWMYCDKMATTDARQIAITKVESGSPADGILAVGDVLLGAAGKRFSYDPRMELGKALSSADSEEAGGKLALTRWRAGKVEEVVLGIPILGTYSATAPFDCPKSKRIFEQGCKLLATQIASPDYGSRNNAITRSLNALALIASGDPEYLQIIKKEAQWAAAFESTGWRTWTHAYVMLMLSEYAIATGDASVMPGLKRLALEAANGQSAVGSWGHNFATPNGNLGGYGMMNSPGIPLTIGLALASAAGAKDAAIDLAIARSVRLLRFYIGKGAIPYGDHVAWTQNHDENGKCGMAAVLFNLVGEKNGLEFFSRMSTASHVAERDTGHTGNFFNLLWAMPGVALSGPRATGAWMMEFGSWYFDLARRWDGGFTHQGLPQAKNDNYAGWDCTGAYLLAYAMPLRKTYLTGKHPSGAPQLGAAAAQSLILDGRGWTEKNPYGSYEALSTTELLARLGSWSPVVRERAAKALKNLKSAVIPELIKMLDSRNPNARYGACEALIQARAGAAPAVGALRNLLRNEDLWLRIKAGQALAAIGTPAMESVPELLERMVRVDVTKDPRGMEQRYLCDALFDTQDGLLARSLNGVDRQALYKAVRLGLKNQDGHSRSSLGSVYGNLSLEEIKPLLPAIFDAIREQAPSGEMFAEGIRMEGLRILAKHRIREGISACVWYTRHQNPWASQDRTPEIMKILLSYGSHAKAVIPELAKVADYFEKEKFQKEKLQKEEIDFPLELKLMKVKCLRDTIRTIEASTEAPKLISLK